MVQKTLWVTHINISMEFLKILFGLNDGLLDSCHCHVIRQTVNNNWLFDFNAGLVDRQKLLFISIGCKLQPGRHTAGTRPAITHTLTRLA